MAKGSTQGKNPTVEWFWNDWLGGTMHLTRFQKGCYMDLLTAQFNTGHLTLDEIKTVLGADFGASWPILSKKFKQDSNGLLYNERLDVEINKKSKFNNSRRENLSSTQDSTQDFKSHMGNGNGIGIDIVKDYFKNNGYTIEAAEKFFKFYSTAEPPWTDSHGKKVKNWKMKAQAVWFRPENKQQESILEKQQTLSEKYLNADTAG